MPAGVTNDTPTANRVRVSVPGKIILMGEHSAVYGKPAVVGAIGRRVTVTAERVTAPRVRLELPRLSPPSDCSWDEVIAVHRATKDRGRLDGRDPAALVKVTLGEAAERIGTASMNGLRLRVESRIPIGAGFGSSAAVAVGVAAATMQLHTGCTERVEEIAMYTERCQHGTPSGVDHTTVLRGGILYFDRDGEGSLRSRELKVPTSLRDAFHVYSSGQPNETTGQVVAAVRALRAREPQTVDPLLERMGKTADRFADLLVQASNPSQLIEIVRESERCLESLGVVPGAVQEQIRNLERCGAAAKISGAGALTGTAAGCLLVLAPEPVATTAGYEAIDAPIGAAGLQIEETV